jgi:hypothetical protein
MESRNEVRVYCNKCKTLMTRTFSAPMVIIPAHMSDANIEANKKNREWLKTPEAKKMDLSRAGDG